MSFLFSPASLGLSHCCSWEVKEKPDAWGVGGCDFPHWLLCCHFYLYDSVSVYGETKDPFFRTSSLSISATISSVWLFFFFVLSFPCVLVLPFPPLFFLPFLHYSFTLWPALLSSIFICFAVFFANSLSTVFIWLNASVLFSAWFRRLMKFSEALTVRQIDSSLM